MEATHDHLHDQNHEHEHAPQVQEWAKTFILLGLGLYFAYTIVSGNLPNYINVAFAWLSYVAAGLFLLLGGISAYNLRRGEHHHHHHEHDHDHAHLSWTTLAIVAIPLVLGTVIPSGSLPVQAAQGNISFTSVSVAAASAFSKPPLERNVLDWLREFNKSSTPAAFNGQEADIVGFVYREPSFGETQFMVARFTISCCVADASAIGLPVSAENAAHFAAGQWVRVQGKFAVGDFRDHKAPILQAASIEVVAEPEHPYLYP